MGDNGRCVWTIFFFKCRMASFSKTNLNSSMRLEKMAGGGGFCLFIRMVDGWDFAWWEDGVGG